EYPLPNEKSRLQRIVVTPDDTFWYSDFGRGYLGRFDPKTGKTTEWASPGGPRSQPYGLTIVGDIVWYAESNVRPNTVVRFDPKMEKFQTWSVPSGGGIIRDMAHDRAGNLWITCSNTNKIGLVRVKGTSK